MTKLLSSAFLLMLAVMCCGTAQAAKPYIPSYFDLGWRMADSDFRIEVVGRLSDVGVNQQRVSGKRVQLTVGGRRAGVDLDWKLFAALLTLAYLTFRLSQKQQRRRGTLFGALIN
ncbi:hypothetical protein [Prosthecobacter sp.]|uniref:hypothetical protein n=1 Tax=Prosthecobacter sp. TaxID=1965333 RepID=UPI0024891D5D|nr:hypothetical protein [Prosthecobacter sp.]MDI1315175.1 hypothetical protein [Prosthecobacter sp.]